MDTNRVVERISSVASWVGVVATITAVASYYTVYQEKISEELMHSAISQKYVSEKLESVVQKSQDQIHLLSNELESVSNATVMKIEELKEQQQRLLLLASTQNLDASSQKEFVELITKKVSTKLEKDSNLNSLENRIKTIEDVVVQSPEKALQIPFIRAEVADLSESIESIQETLRSVDNSLDDIKVYKSQVESLTNQVNQTNNWMIGIFGALGVSVLGMLIGNVFQHRKAQS